MSKGEGLMTHGPVYRPSEFRELTRDPLDVPRRNYAPGPALIPLDSRLKDQRSDVPSAPKAEPRRNNIGASGYTQLARERSAAHLGARTVSHNSIAGRVLSVLATADRWMSAHEIYLRIRELGRHHAGDGFGAISKGSDVPRAIGWHVGTGKIAARPCERHEAAANIGRKSKTGFLEYRLSSLLTTEERSS